MMSDLTLSLLETSETKMLTSCASTMAIKLVHYLYLGLSFLDSLGYRTVRWLNSPSLITT